MASVFARVESLTDRTYLIVENDRFGQFPFMYVIMGDDKCILIDTGCGTADYRDFVTKRINTRNLPYLVINTHVHFDHIGCNHRFCGAHKEGCIDVCMGCRDRKFSENYEVSSLAMAHNGAEVKEFTVSKWLNEGDLIYLDDKNPIKERSLEVIFAPGHTPDSIALFAHYENRMFVGDTIYPYTVVHLDGMGSNVPDYFRTLKKLHQFVALQNSQKSGSSEKEDTKLEDDLPDKSVPSEPELSKQQQQAISDFFNTLGVDASEADFSIESVMEICGWNAAEAVDFYLSNAADVPSMCPPIPKSGSAGSAAGIGSGSANTQGGTVLSCGHVEGNLPWAALDEVYTMLEIIKVGALPPHHIDGEYGEYTNGNFNLMLPLRVKWE